MSCEQLKKKQATTTFITNLLRVNHVEYKQDFKNNIHNRIWQKSYSCRLLKFGKEFLWILKLTHASQMWKKKVKVSCCESHSNLYTADEAAVLVTLDNKSTLLFILDNSALKIGNCCWLVLLLRFACVCSVNKKNDKRWSSSVTGRHFSYRYLPVTGESVQISSRVLIYVCCLFGLLIKSSMTPGLSPMPVSVFPH